MLELADRSSRLLVEVVGLTPVPPSTEKAGRDVAALHHQAVWFMAIIATRAVRACIAVMRVGYQEQAAGYARLLSELLGAAEKVVDDQSGEYAQQWLEGKTKTGANLAGQQLYGLLSGPAHASVKGILDWLTIPREGGNHDVVIGPERRAEAANATLVYVAGIARDIAARLAALRGVRLDLAQLDHDLTVGQDQWLVRDTAD
jgi:hypothetical protein